MAERKRMTAEQVVGYLLEGEGLDFLRESLAWVVQELMEAEVSELVGARRGERAPEERLAHRNGYRSRVWSTRAGELELAIPKIRRSLVERGLTGVELVVSDAHAGLKRAIAQVLGCSWQRCSVHFLREALGHARREQQPMLAALLRPLFNAEAGADARLLLGEALERLSTPLPKVAALLEEAEEDLLAFYAFPPDHWTKLRSTNPLERVNREIGRRTDVVGIFPNDRSLIRLAASVVIEQNDEWLVGRRYLSAHSLETVLDRENEEQEREEAHQLTTA